MPEKQIISGSVSRPIEPLPKQVGRLVLDENLRLEVETRAESQVFVAGSGIAIRAAVLATAIRVQAKAEGDIRALVFGDDALRPVGEEQGLDAPIVVRLLRERRRRRIVFVVRLALESQEPIRRIDRRPASFSRFSRSCL